MARPKRNGLNKFFFLSGFLIVFFIGFIAYSKVFAARPVDSRSMIEQGISSAKQSKELTPEQEQLLRVQIAIIDHIARTGQPPSTLYDLIPTYFDTVPLNPRTKKSFVYKRNGGQFSLRADESEQVQVASAKGTSDPKTPGHEGGNEIVELSSDGFVNPNTLEIEEFVYDPTGKRDPFRPFDVSKKFVLDKTKSPLEQYDLGQLRVTAVLDDLGSGKRALVEDESGKGYTVLPGTKIGLNNGVVVSVEADRVKVLESKTEAFTGKELQTVVEMKLISEASSDEEQGGKKGKKKKKRDRDR